MNTQGEWSVVVRSTPLAKALLSPPCSAWLCPPWGGYAPHPAGSCPSLALRCARDFCGMLAHCKRLRLLRARPSLLRASPPPPVRAGSRSLRSAGAALPLRPLALARRPAGPPLAPRARLCVRVAFRSVAHAAFARASGVAPPRRRRLIPRALVALASLALLFRSARAGPPALGVLFRLHKSVVLCLRRLALSCSHSLALLLRAFRRVARLSPHRHTKRWLRHPGCAGAAYMRTAFALAYPHAPHSLSASAYSIVTSGLSCCSAACTFARS